jgi:hypothetical protein
MANTDRPNGFKVVGSLSHSYCGQALTVLSPTDNLFLGDLVETTTTGRARGDGGVREVGRAEASDAILGVVVGWQPDPAALDRVYHAASTTYGVYVNDDPNVILECQSDDGTPTVLLIGANFNIVVAAGSTTSGASNMELDGDSGATTATLPLKLIGFSDRPDNDVSAANMKCLVTINNHLHKGGTGTAGLA